MLPILFTGPGGAIRTRVLHIPNVAVYAAGLHPDINKALFCRID